MLLAIKIAKPGRNANNKLIFTRQTYYIRNNNGISKFQEI